MGDRGWMGDHARLVSLVEREAPGAAWVCRADTRRPVQHTGWSCGYANLGELLALCGCSSPEEAEGGPGGACAAARPAVAEVQAWIDEAHRDGFDPDGFAELGFVSGTRQWVGTSEAAAVLRHRGVPARLGAFRAGVNCATPAEALLGALRAHFASFVPADAIVISDNDDDDDVGDVDDDGGDPGLRGKVRQTSAPPAMVNWRGHSVLVAAIGVDDDVVAVYDPSGGALRLSPAAHVVPARGTADIEICCADPRGAPLEGEARRHAKDLGDAGLALLS